MVSGKVVNATQKSVDEARWIIRHFTEERATVVSLFDGTGTFSLAAVLENRDAISVDIDVVQLNRAKARVAELQELEAIRSKFWLTYLRTADGPERFSMEELKKEMDARRFRDAPPSEEYVDSCLRQFYYSSPAGRFLKLEEKNLDLPQLQEKALQSVRDELARIFPRTSRTIDDEEVMQFLGGMRRKLLSLTLPALELQVCDMAAAVANPEQPKKFCTGLFDKLIQRYAPNPVAFLETVRFPLQQQPQQPQQDVAGTSNV